MSNIGYIEAKKEILQIFTQHDHRVIVFWYDETQEFLDDVKTDTLDGVKTIVFEYNEFAIKHLLEVEDVESNFLLYFPCARPSDKENWLLDILLYSQEYYADEVALTMRKLGLTNPYLRKVIDRCTKFFKSDARINDLKKLVTVNDSITETDLLNGMLAVLVKAKFIKTEAILHELIFDVEKGDKYKEVCSYGLEDYLWNQITTLTNYAGVQQILFLVKQYMMTAFAKTSKFDILHSFYKQYVIDSSNQAANDALLLVDNLKNDLRYPDLQSYIGSELRIQDLLQSRGIDDISKSDVFEILDTFIIRSIQESLNHGSLDYDFFETIILTNRINSIWYATHKHEYNLILSIVQLKKSLETPLYDNQTAEEYIKQYVNELYKVDQNYRNVIFLFEQVEDHDEVLEELKSKINLAYERHLDKLGSFFSKSLEKKSSWEFFGEVSLKNFYSELQRINYKKMFVIISDAFRYEVAAELLEKVKTDSLLKGQATLSNMISPIPSITKLGMASLLPNKSIQYGNDVLVDGNSTMGIENRHRILQKRHPNYAAISYQDLNAFNRAQLREYMKDKNLIYIYHNTIDSRGENEETKVFDAAYEAIDEILSLIKKLYNTLQISNYIVTADHGFVYRDTKVSESQKYSDIMRLKLQESSKRYLITNDETTIPYTLHFGLDYLGDNNPNVILPYGYDYFKTQGGGIQYVHGGASLQEIVVPLLKISELRSAAQKENMGPVGVRLKSINRTITQRSFTVDFEQFEKVLDKKTERKLITYFADEKGNEVSGKYPFIANSDSDDLSQRVTRVRFTLNNVDFDRNKRYFLILKDDATQEILESVAYVIDILGFKPIF
jgi:uncharacterized protein (TIGR02687 family)